MTDDSTTITKEADKGGGIVVMNTDFYKRKILEMLLDDSYYSQVQDNCRKETFQKLKNLIGTISNLTIKKYNFYSILNPRQAHFMVFLKFIKAKR